MKPITKSLIMMAIVLGYTAVSFLTLIHLNLFLGIAMIGVGTLILLKQIEEKGLRPIIQEDKANHFIVGSVITALALVILQPIWAFTLCFSMACVKEVMDRFYGNPSFYDFLWTCAGGLFTLFVHYL
jgi:hypothetical protein